MVLIILNSRGIDQTGARPLFMYREVAENSLREISAPREEFFPSAKEKLLPLLRRNPKQRAGNVKNLPSGKLKLKNRAKRGQSVAAKW